jgi:hypothetical protein
MNTSQSKNDMMLKMTKSKKKIFFSILFFIVALQCFFGKAPVAPIEGGGPSPPLEIWQLIIGGITCLVISVLFLIKKDV